MEFKEMLRKVAAVLDLTPETILENNRFRSQVDARYILYLLLEEQNLAIPDIALKLNQPRTTVISGIEQAQSLLETNRYFKTKYEKCKAVI